jgi:hypothetical protein
MPSLHSIHYSYEVLKGARLDLPGSPSLEVWLSEPISRLRVGRWFLREPHGNEWAEIDEDEFVIAPAAWGLARFLWLLCQVDPGTKLETFVVPAADGLYLPLEVCGVHGTVGELRFSVLRRGVQWQGRARNYAEGKSCIDELESLLFAEPEELAEYRLALPWKGSLGWNGHKLTGQRTIVRPAAYTKTAIAARREPKPVSRLGSQDRRPTPFTVRELSLSENAPQRNASKRPLRFTDIWPQPELWRTTPNWRRALDEEGLTGQDESTLKPGLEQRFIDDTVDFTAGEAWLPDGRIIPVLIGITAERLPHFVVCFDETFLWEFDCRLEGYATSLLTPAQADRFPVRVVSQLSRSPSDPGDTIRVVIDERGKITPWNFT